VRERLGEAGRDPRGAGAVSGAQRKCVRGALRTLDQARVFSRVIPFGERHLRRTIAEFIEHYHGERNHQGLRNELIDGAPPVDGRHRNRRRQRLAGLLNYYARAA
jgi:hypothetical protein